jgi:mono/diheme cytochrome c family protein
MSRASLRLLTLMTLMSVFLLAACDESVAFHEPDPSFNRMLEQPRVDAYEGPMRLPPPGTLPHEAPPALGPVTRELVLRGRSQFETFCAACHGILGDGGSVVAEKMALRKPPSFHEPHLVALAPDAIVGVIERGYGLMPSYADAISPNDRWAVANYIKALQLSRTEASR